MKRYFDTLPNLKKPRAHKEDQLQIQTMQLLRTAYPNVLAIHCPNGGKRSAREGERFKRMGVLAGTPDILMWYGGKAYAIELKVGKNGLTDTQKLWRDRFCEQGGVWALCRSLDDVAILTQAWFCKSHFNDPLTNE